MSRSIFRLGSGLLLAASLPMATLAQPARKNLHIFLLIGQSNMSGRAALGPGDTATLPRAWLLKSQTEWAPARNPINLYSTIETNNALKKLGPGYTFTKRLQAQVPDAEVGLVANAKGATAIGTWLPGTTYYSEAVKRTKWAQNFGTLKAVLWHQGEGDSKDPSRYLDNAKTLITALRKDLGNDSLPFIAGELGEYNNTYAAFNRTVYGKFTDILPHLGLVQSDGLKAFDGVHFDTEGQHALGERYADKVREMVYGKPVSVIAPRTTAGRFLAVTRSGSDLRIKAPDGARERTFDFRGKAFEWIPNTYGSGTYQGE